jgi:hypothetical protein
MSSVLNYQRVIAANEDIATQNLEEEGGGMKMLNF